MFIKKTAMLAILGSSLVVTTVRADNGTINFVGTITDDACTIINTPANPLTVTLGNVSSSAFTGKGSTAAPTAFKISLSDCPDTVTSASVKFDGAAVEGGDNTVIALTADGGNEAKGVGVQLTDASGTVIPLYTSTQSYPLVEGVNDLDFTARYAATAATVGAGSANSTSNFTIVYN